MQGWRRIASKGYRCVQSPSALLAIISCLLLVPCATPCGEEDIAGDVPETDLGNGKIPITVAGNDWTSFESMEAMWLRKAYTTAASRGSGKYQTLPIDVATRPAV
jgi:hypothetical protein